MFLVEVESSAEKGGLITYHQELKKVIGVKLKMREYLTIMSNMVLHGAK